MKYASLLLTVLAEYMAGSASFRAGSLLVTVADTTGASVHLTLAAALLAAEKAYAGDVGTFQSGNISITLAPWVG